METIHVSYPDGHEHPILFDGLATVPAHLEAVGLAPGQALVVTDSNVADLMLSPLLDALTQAGWQAQSHTVEPGESSKSMAALAELYDFALQRAIDRKTPLIALGGGVIGDLAGFGAATLLRGIPLVHVPTTLVSQVDSSIGGKTGINHPTGKNLVGAFYQPKLVVTDTQRLQTLPDREWTSGLGEVVKHGLIDGPEHVRRLIQVWPDLLNRDGERLDELVCRSARVKVGVVTQDQRETGLRSVLNFGHTVGHGIERAAGYGQVSHGEAVAAGMAVALRISDRKYPQYARQDSWELLRCLGWPALGDFDIDEVLRAVEYDKKRVAGSIRFVLLPQTGQPVVSLDVDIEDILEAWESLA